MRKVVHILLITQHEQDGVGVAIGPAFWDRLEASQAMHSLRDRGMTVQLIEREVRGTMPEMRAAPAVPARGE
jgi:hypothetical protein